MAAESVALTFLQSHGYWLLLLIFILDGSFAALAGLAASQGIFNVYIVLILAFLGGILPDSMWFFIGKIGRRSIIEKYFGKRLKKAKESKIKQALEKNYFKTLFVIKFTPYIQIPGFIAAGTTKLTYRKYMSMILPIDSLNAIIFTFGGYFFGKAFTSLFGGNISFIGFAVVALMILLFFFIRAYRKFASWTYKKIEKFAENGNK
jgi:membrane-associated protein